MKLGLLFLLLIFSLLTTVAFVSHKALSTSSSDAKTEVMRAAEPQGPCDDRNTGLFCLHNGSI
jgi:hypothetical protein